MELTVTDSGPGLNEQALAHAFDPFFATKSGEGSGLGLPMVYDQIKMSGGRVVLGNHADRANVTLRLAAEHTEPTLVLLVEDSPGIRQSVHEMLTGLGHNVIEAQTAEEAEKLAHLPGIGLILSDISLPNGCNGLDMLTSLRNNGVRAPAA